MEVNFKTKVGMFFLIILLVVLSIVALTINKKTSNADWPPYVANCPDYWLDLSSNGSMCYNKHGLGTCALPIGDNKNTVDFTLGVYTGSEGNCNKKKWATNCGVSWDGITYGYGKNDPCSK